MTKLALSKAEIDARIVFHADSQIMEVSFEGIRLSNSLEVNQYYDRIEERIAETGEELWFFLVNYCDTRIDNEAWFAFSRRGKELNQAHSMGSVRFDASEITLRQIERSAGTDAFDPNMFFDRESAVTRLQSLPSKRREKIVLKPSFKLKDWIWRIDFSQEDQIMNIDLSDFSFEHSRDVNDVYDFIESQVEPTAQKWYFLIKYDGTRIQSPAWVEFAARGKRLNQEFSLGSVRFAAGSETESDIRLRAESQGFRPNIRNTRAEAMELINELKAANAKAE